MFTTTVLLMGTVFAAAAIAAMAVMVVQTAPALETGVASPFGQTGTCSADTLEGGMNFRIFPPAKPGEWQILSCDTIREAEMTLDSLENHGVKDREMLALSNNCFAVRWKV
jgi:hypothetical protein